MADVVLMDLWLPIVVATVAGHFLSFVLWAVLPHHKSEWAKIPAETAVMDLLRDRQVPPGQYMFPNLVHGDFKDPEKVALYTKGPIGTLSVWPGVSNMPRNMILTILFYLVSATVIAYLATIALDTSATGMAVFRFTATVGLLTFTFGGIPNGIWFRKSPRSMVTEFLDGVLMAVLFGGVFAALWPEAQAVLSGGAG
ncbi:MAG: hypothetical protein KC983_00065 [Phycisphaerales bacterium]|nr:hypothetical protein [Phycisphaerales bacterium]